MAVIDGTRERARRRRPGVRRHRPVRARHHARHQRHHRAQGRQDRADRHRRLPRRDRDRRRGPLRPVRHQHRQDAAAGAARAALHGAGAPRRARRRAPGRSTRPAVRRVAKRIADTGHRGDRRGADPRLRQSGARAAHRRHPGRALPRHQRQPVVGRQPRGARVRAHLHHHRQRLRAAADGGLPEAPAARLHRARLHPADPPDDLGRQPCQPARRPRSSPCGWWSRARPAAPSWPGTSRSSAARPASSPSTWAAPPPRSA